MLNEIDHESFVASYEFQGSIVRVPLTREQITQTSKGQSLVDHESIHFFQNYFTNIGISYLVIIKFFNLLVDELLHYYKPTIRIPMVSWIPTTELFRDNDKVFTYHDRILKIIKQLSSSYISQLQVQSTKDYLRNVDIVDKVMKRKSLSIDTNRRMLKIDGKDILNIDTSAIFESMAFAQEQLSNAIRLAGIPPGQPAGNIGGARILDALTTSLNNDLINPTIINYTFPLLMLIQAGYQPYEAIQLVIIIAYFSLMSHFSMPSLPELGVTQDVKFGSHASETFTQLLLNLCNDSLLSIINTYGLTTHHRARFITFADKLLEAVNSPSLSEAFEIYQKFTTPNFVIDDNMSDLEIRWLNYVTKSANQFNDYLRNCSSAEGILRVTSLSHFLTQLGVGPLIICEDGLYFFSKDRSVSQQTYDYTFKLNVRKYLAFGDYAKNLGTEISPNMHAAMFKFLRNGFGVTDVEEFRL